MLRKYFKQAIGLALIILISDPSLACVLRQDARSRQIPVYVSPTDDTNVVNNGNVGSFLRRNQPYRCLRITANGYVQIQQGGSISFVSIAAFLGNPLLLLPPGGQPRTLIPERNTPNGNEIRLTPVNHQGVPQPVGRRPDDGLRVGGETPPRTPRLPRDPRIPNPINSGENFYQFFPQASPDGPRGSDSRYQLPMSGAGDRTGPCGGFHIRGHRTPPYLNPTTACLFAGASQQWQQEVCRGNQANCRIMYGDFGHNGREPSEWPHASHNNGECMDIWPMRRPGHGLDQGVTVNSGSYSSALTGRFAQMLVQWGIETTPRPGGNGTPQMFFNDPNLSSLGFRNLIHHDDHMHVCIRDNAANRRKCQQQFNRDPNICHFNQSTSRVPRAPRRGTPSEN